MKVARMEGKKSSGGMCHRVMPYSTQETFGNVLRIVTFRSFDDSVSVVHELMNS